jgi:hypothetical protein
MRSKGALIHGTMRVVAFMTQPSMIDMILPHLGTSD